MGRGNRRKGKSKKGCRECIKVKWYRGRRKGRKGKEKMGIQKVYRECIKVKEEERVKRKNVKIWFWQIVEINSQYGY